MAHLPVLTARGLWALPVRKVRRFRHLLHMYVGFLVSSPPGLSSTHPSPRPRRARRGPGVVELRSQAGEETHMTYVVNVHVRENRRIIRTGSAHRPLATNVGRRASHNGAAPTSPTYFLGPFP